AGPFSQRDLGCILGIGGFAHDLEPSAPQRLPQPHANRYLAVSDDYRSSTIHGTLTPLTSVHREPTSRLLLPSGMGQQHELVAHADPPAVALSASQLQHRP